MTETIIGDGQSAPFTVLNQGDILRLVGPDMSLNNGPSASSVSINSGGLMTVDYGRVDGTQVNAGGEYYLNAGSNDFATGIRGGVAHIAFGASASNGFVQDGGVLYVSGSVLSEAIFPGGQMVVNEAGYTSGAAQTPNAAPDMTYMQDIRVYGGDLRIVAGVPDSISLYDGGTITLPSISYNASVTLNYDAAKSILEIRGSTTYPIHLGFGNSDVTRFMISGNSAGETVVSLQALPVCFCRGTLIATPDGPLPVEDIAVGTLVITAAGKEKAVVWKGGGSAPADGATRPVIVRRDAFGSSVPTRDLRVTAGHSFLFGAVLIPISELINGSSILWDEEAQIAEYFHLELADHDILLAEGALAESYRDDGNRGAFHAADGTPDRRCSMLPFAPVVTEGAVVDAVWRTLADRAGHVEGSAIDNPDLHLIADGQRVDPIRIDGDRYAFHIDRAVGEVRIGSRHTTPALDGSARDFRQLGVALRGCVIRDVSGETELPASGSAWGEGFHHPEEGAFRWTNGASLLSPDHYAGRASFDLTLDVHCFARYPVKPDHGNL